jgi:hypothetical protein
MDKKSRRCQPSGMRSFRPARILLFLGALGLNAAAEEFRETPPVAACLSYDGSAYVALSPLQPWFGIKAEIPGVAAQKIRVQLDGKEWEFLNGGDSIRLPDGGERPLARPLLVVNGELYLDASDAHTLFGIDVLPSTVTWNGHTVTTRIQPVAAEHRAHHVGALSVEREGARLTADVEAWSDLQGASPAVKLPKGAVYLCRRRATIDGVRYVLLTDTGANPLSFLVKEEALQRNSTVERLQNSAWSARLSWFRAAASAGRGLRAGDREQLPKALCATTDFCWSMRPLEKGFLVNEAAGGRRTGMPALTLFLSGRWMEQHPADMETLIGLARDKHVAITWGLHSWVHPKAGDFMNDLSVEAVREDTLKLERQFLEWGLVPTVYYRFPGLIHDPSRLQAILDLDLLPIDCDAWVAVQSSGTHPFGGPIRDGSIVLVHGNGNEPKGIAGFEQWLSGHGEWQWRPLSDFLPQPGAPHRE